jgi:hypothetical protein
MLIFTVIETPGYQNPYTVSSITLKTLEFASGSYMHQAALYCFEEEPRRSGKAVAL